MCVCYLRLKKKKGILAGVWPCGTITVLSELFLSEGKGQVYGTIHGLLQEHQENTTQLSKSHITSEKLIMNAIFYLFLQNI